jgi:hypothetical protein
MDDFSAIHFKDSVAKAREAGEPQITPITQIFLFFFFVALRVLSG